MKKNNTLIKTWIALFFIILYQASCTTIKLPSKGEAHLLLTKNDQLNGHYSKIDTFNDGRIVQADVIIKALDNKTLDFQIYSNGSTITLEKAKGNIKRGYFKLKREWNADFIVGPLVWTLTDHVKYLGLTKENNLVILNSGGGMMFLVALPFMAASNQRNIEYVRIK